MHALPAFGAVLLVLLSQPPVIPQIQGPEKLDAGHLAVYTIECEDSAQVRWLVIPPDSSGLSEQDVSATFENNRKLAFATPQPGNYRLVAAVAYNQSLDLLSLVVRVEGSGPSPGPSPTPPNPSPVPPPPGSWSEWAIRTAKATVPESFRSAEGKRVADALRTVIEAINAGRISDARKARENVRAAVRESLQTLEAVNRWKTFSDALDQRMDEQQDKLKTLQDYVSVWNEIAKALESL